MQKTWSRVFKAIPRKRQFANALLAKMTHAERRLWAELSKINVGRKSMPYCPWKPQVVVKGWIVDFYSDLRLIAIEVDGPIHDSPEQRERDRTKDEVLRHYGIKVLRFTNAQVLKDPAYIVKIAMGWE